MPTSKLGLYNDALLYLGEEKLSSLSETGTRKNALDDAYEQALDYCLEAAFWKFAKRAVQMDASVSAAPTFGYSYSFPKPTDFVRMYKMSVSPTLDPPLLDFVDEPNFWYANTTPIYAEYISDDTAYGFDLSLWSVSFSDFAALRLAMRTCKRITGNDPSDKLTRSYERGMAMAKSRDAMNEPPGFPPTGTWVRSRTGNWGNRSLSDGTIR